MQRIALLGAALLSALAFGTGSASAAADPPVLTAPTSGFATNGTSLTVTYVLAQTAGGLPAITLTPTTGAPRTFPLTEDGAGEHTVALDFTAEAIADGTYGLKVGYEDVEGTHESATATVVIDHSTQAPQLTSPVSGATVSGALGVGYALPEAAQAGSVTLFLTPAGGGAAHTLTLTNGAPGAAALTINRAAPASSPGVAAASPESPIGDGTYDVSLHYRDALGNPAAVAAAAGVVLTTPAEIPAPTRTPGMVGTTVATADRTAPSITGARILAKAFTPPHPSRVRFRLSEAASVSFVLQRLRRGVWVRVATSTKRAPAGEAFIRLPSGLRPARHRLTIRATDTAGNRSAAVQLSFQVR